jgi:hypothetical protein
MVADLLKKFTDPDAAGQRTEQTSFPFFHFILRTKEFWVNP